MTPRAALALLVLLGCGGPGPASFDRAVTTLTGDYEVVLLLLSENGIPTQYRPPAAAGFLSFYPDGSYFIDFSLAVQGIRFEDRGAYRVDGHRYVCESQSGPTQERALPADLRTLAFSGFVDRAGRRTSFTGYFTYGRPRV